MLNFTLAVVYESFSAATDEAADKAVKRMFDVLDVNGDGTMEWDEFTGFCIDQGIAATAGHSSSAVPDQLYSERTKWEDKTRTFASAVTRVDWTSKCRSSPSSSSS